LGQFFHEPKKVKPSHDPTVLWKKCMPKKKKKTEEPVWNSGTVYSGRGCPNTQKKKKKKRYTKKRGETERGKSLSFKKGLAKKRFVR